MLLRSLNAWWASFLMPRYQTNWRNLSERTLLWVRVVNSLLNSKQHLDLPLKIMSPPTMTLIQCKLKMESKSEIDSARRAQCRTNRKTLGDCGLCRLVAITKNTSTDSGTKKPLRVSVSSHQAECFWYPQSRSNVKCVARITWNYGGSEVYIMGSFTGWDYMIKMHKCEGLKTDAGITHPYFEISMVIRYHSNLIIVLERRSVLLLLCGWRKSEVRSRSAINSRQEAAHR